jgi:hypothetical protein
VPPRAINPQYPSEWSGGREEDAGGVAFDNDGGRLGGFAGGSLPVEEEVWMGKQGGEWLRECVCGVVGENSGKRWAREEEASFRG